MLNPELKPGDRVILLYMKDETVPPGTVGTVTKKSTVFGTDHYNVKWDNGSSLALLSDVDAWTLEKKKKIEKKKSKKKRKKLKERKKLCFLLTSFLG